METILQTQIVQPIFQKIYEIRGQKVMLDFGLAELYKTETKYLKRAVNRNIERFPADFMFQLTKEEYDDFLRCQFGTFQDYQGLQAKYLPYAFTEHGIAMLSSVLRSGRAIETNIAIVRAFVALRQYALNYAELSSRLSELEKTSNSNFSEIFDILEELTAQKKLYENRRPIGFIVRDEN